MTKTPTITPHDLDLVKQSLTELEGKAIILHYANIRLRQILKDLTGQDAVSNEELASQVPQESFL